VSYVLDGVGSIQSVLVGYDSTGIWMVDGDPEPSKYPTLQALIKDYDNVLQRPVSAKSMAAPATKGSHYNIIPGAKKI
jgi:hypothetical protein